MMGKTAKITIEGRPEGVERILRALRACLEITYESKNSRIQGRPDDVRRYIRVEPPNGGEPHGR